MESQQIPGDFQEMSCMEAQPPLGNKFCCLAFLLPDCDTSGQKERTELDQSVPRLVSPRTANLVPYLSQDAASMAGP